MNNKCWYHEVCNASCSDHCIRFMEMQFLLEHSGIPRARQDPKVLTLIPEQCDLAVFRELQLIKQQIVNVVQNGKSLYIYSEYFGNGKTTWAIKLLLKYFDCVWNGNGFRVRGLFIHVPSFLNRLKDNINKPDAAFLNMKDLIKDVDVVVWDDIGACKLSEYDHSILLSYIDERVLKNLANIYTGNLYGNALQKALGGRLHSRVWSASSLFELKGHDRRGE